MLLALLLALLLFLDMLALRRGLHLFKHAQRLAFFSTSGRDHHHKRSPSGTDNKNNKKDEGSRRRRPATQTHLFSTVDPTVPGPSITLTADEAALFATFKRMVDEERLGTTVRVAGGWVRDKLLANNHYSKHKGPKGKLKEKNDIDIALDNMTGAQFAMKLNAWSLSRGGQAVQFGVIQQNPDKSKHLETATAQLGKFEVDFVNLRTETYVSTSRIPDVTGIGTPLEDALRRDLTINSLFYNVNTGAVEDFTQEGLHDLELGLIQTPLPPLTTLQDDPLRALRAVRFTCRFNFDVSPDLWEACSHESVRQVLLTKVSKERVCQELEQMLEGAPSPSTGLGGAARACYMLHSLQLLPLIFNLPLEIRPVSADNATRASVDSSAPAAASSIAPLSFHDHGLATLLTVALLETHTSSSGTATTSPGTSSDSSPLSRLVGRFQLSPEYKAERKLLNFAALCAQAASFECQHPQKRRKSLPLTDFLLQSELRMKGKDGDHVTRIQQAAVQIKALLSELLLYSEGSEGGGEATEDVSVSPLLSRQRLGTLLRSAGACYPPALLLATAELVVEHLQAHSHGHGPAPSSSASATPSLDPHFPFDLPTLCGLLDGGICSGAPASSEPAGAGVALFRLPHTARVIAEASRLARAVEDQNLVDVYKLAPLLNGEALKTIFLRVPKGPAFGQIVEAQMQWLVLHPEGTPEQLRSHLEAAFGDFL